MELGLSHDAVILGHVFEPPSDIHDPLECAYKRAARQHRATDRLVPASQALLLRAAERGAKP